MIKINNKGTRVKFDPNFPSEKHKLFCGPCEPSLKNKELDYF